LSEVAQPYIRLFAALQFLGVRFDFVELLHVRPKFNRVTGRTFLSVMTPAALDYTSTIRVGPFFTG
jgi:hypothetical protein